jgi:hypothetical protein
MKFSEVKESPTVTKSAPKKDFELAISELGDSYRNTINRADAVRALRTQADLVERDAGWKADINAGDPEPRDPHNRTRGDIETIDHVPHPKEQSLAPGEAPKTVHDYPPPGQTPDPVTGEVGPKEGHEKPKRKGFKPGDEVPSPVDWNEPDIAYPQPDPRATKPAEDKD